MKKWFVLPLAFFPVLLGAGMNFLLTVLRSSALILWGFSFLTTVLWYYCGFLFAALWKKPFVAIPAAHSIGVLSLLIFLWQEHLTVQRIPALHAAAQYFSGGVTMLALHLSAPFGTVVDGVRQVPMTVVQLIGFALLALIFSAGYLTAHRKLQSVE